MFGATFSPLMTTLGATRRRLPSLAGTRRFSNIRRTPFLSCKSLAIRLQTVLTLASLSEYGCNTNARDFGEVAALYSSSL